MKTSLTKSAIVTGASGGIGRVVAKRLANDGFAITVHYAGNPAKAEAVVAEINNAGGKAIAVQADVAKAADVENLFKKTLEAFANELRGRNITVNAVAPGQVRTDLFLKGKSDALIDELKKMNPLERLGMPEDMANLVSFLAGPEGGWINSQVVRANGGFA